MFSCIWDTGVSPGNLLKPTALSPILETDSWGLPGTGDKEPKKLHSQRVPADAKTAGHNCNSRTQRLVFMICLISKR